MGDIMKPLEVITAIAKLVNEHPSAALKSIFIDDGIDIMPLLQVTYNPILDAIEFANNPDAR
jgi:hypothetical protein